VIKQLSNSEKFMRSTLNPTGYILQSLTFFGEQQLVGLL